MLELEFEVVVDLLSLLVFWSIVAILVNQFEFNDLIFARFMLRNLLIGSVEHAILVDPPLSQLSLLRTECCIWPALVVFLVSLIVSGKPLLLYGMNAAFKYLTRISHHLADLALVAALSFPEQLSLAKLLLKVV